MERAQLVIPDGRMIVGAMSTLVTLQHIFGGVIHSLDDGKFKPNTSNNPNTLDVTKRARTK